MAKYYAIAYGRQTGIFTDENEYNKYMYKFPAARGKSFTDCAEAEKWFLQNKGNAQGLSQKVYVVVRGHVPGIFSTSKAYLKSMRGFSKAKGKSCQNLEEAKKLLIAGWGKKKAEQLIALGMNPQKKLSETTQQTKLDNAVKSSSSQKDATLGTDNAEFSIDRVEELLKKQYAFTLKVSDDVRIYTDASYERKEEMDYVGVAASLYLPDGTRFFEMTNAFSEKGLDSIQAEALAIISALFYLENTKKVQIFTDCQGILRILENDEKDSSFIVKLMVQQIRLHGAEVYWIHGHGDDSANNRVDKLARMARKQYMKM